MIQTTRLLAQRRAAQPAVARRGAAQARPQRLLAFIHAASAQAGAQQHAAGPISGSRRAIQGVSASSSSCQHRCWAPAATAVAPLLRVHVAAAASAADAATDAALPDGSVSVVLLAGGVGKRMGAPIPKQYLELAGQPIATYSLATFARMRQVGEIVIVCDPSWRYVFEARLAQLQQQQQQAGGKAATKLPEVRWALPGAERQDSVSNGLAAVRPEAAIVAVHDSARPLITPSDAARCMADGATVGAAVLGVPVKPTIKQVDPATGLVIATLDRSKLWEVQTPQCIRPGLLREGFRLVAERGLEVTDDVSIIEALGLPVKITSGAYTNIKVTTPEDMSVAEGFLDELGLRDGGSSSSSESSSSSSSTVAAAAGAVAA